MWTWFQKMFSRFRKPKNEPIMETSKNEFDEDSAYSILLKEKFKLISSTQGILMMCTGGIHAFLMMEYLEWNEETNKFVRSFQRLDFGPKSKAHILLGKGRLRVTSVTMETEEGTEKWEKWEKIIKVGPHWDVEVEKVKGTFDAAVNAHSRNKEVFTNEKLQLLYSLPGDSSGSVMPKSTKTNNCVTFSRKFMTTYYAALGLTEDNIKILDGNEKYYPVQSPWPMVLHYGRKQEREILL